MKPSSTARKTTLVVFLDKSWPPNHSFVDGMLATLVPTQFDARVVLCVSGNGESRRVRRYLEASCLVGLAERRGISRVTNFFHTLRICIALGRRAAERNDRLVIFVRNDPTFLFGASLSRRMGFCSQLIFQSSFPHELASDNWFKRHGAKTLYRLSASAVDGVTAVSPLGLERLRRLFPLAGISTWIPLLADMAFEKFPRAKLSESNALKLIYIGTHDASRSLNVVLEGVRLATVAGAKVSAVFVGGTSSELRILRSVSCLSELERDGVATVVSRVDRADIPSFLRNADVGLSLIPPNGYFRESSPTKLVEYLGAGLVAIASAGIPLQESISTKSGGALLVKFDARAIGRAITMLYRDRAKVRKMQHDGRRYAEQHLTYNAYGDQMRRLLNFEV